LKGKLFNIPPIVKPSTFKVSYSLVQGNQSNSFYEGLRAFIFN